MNGLNSSTNDDNADDASMMMTSTVLRIKRRRTETPIPFIRLEGVRGVEESSSTSLAAGAGAGKGGEISLEEANYRRRQNQSPEAATASTTSSSSSVVWKRVREQHPSTISDTSSIRVINAVLGTDEMTDEIDNNKDDEDYEHERRSKRRKLTILDSVTQPTQQQQQSQNSNLIKSSKGKPIKVLDPLTRMADDSLQEVLTGSKTIRDHYTMVTTNPVFSTATRTQKNNMNMTTIQNWLCWSHTSGGNILHCCALWNDDVMAREILSPSPANVDSSHLGRMAAVNSNATTSYNSFLRQITESVDGDGRTPYEVAELCTHENVCKVLAEFGGDTSNYIYDVFCHLPLKYDNRLAADTDNNVENGGDLTVSGSRSGRGGGMVDSSVFDSNNITTHSDDTESWMDVMTTAYLTSGVGYWTLDGELILEPDADKRSRGGRMDNDEYNDDDIDSNCEDCDANDYPDFESEEEENGDDNDENERYMAENNRPAAFDPYQGGDCEYEYDWEQDLGAVYGEDERKDDYHYYASEFDDDEDE
jgi:hypothetical protein